MSRIGKLPVTTPQGVSVALDESQIEIKGPKGTLNLALTGAVQIRHEGDQIYVSPRDENDSHCRAMWGTVRARIHNMVRGVTEGFEKTLELVGVGYRAQMRGKDIELSLGFSHPLVYSAPEGVNLATAAAGEIKISGADIQKVGQTAAEIRRYRPPEPYKGKGVRYSGEYVRRKAGKKK